MEEEMTSIEDN
jgi:hypothetical protein